MMPPVQLTTVRPDPHTFPEEMYGWTFFAFSVSLSSMTLVLFRQEMHSIASHLGFLVKLFPVYRSNVFLILMFSRMYFLHIY